MINSKVMLKKTFPLVVSSEEREEIIQYLENRFGFKRELFTKYLILKGTQNFWLFPFTEHLHYLEKLTPEVVGLLFLRKVSNYLKPTSSFLQRFGKYATKNIITLDNNEIKSLKEKKKIEINLPLEPGYVILKDQNWILGCGLYLPGKLFAYFEEKIWNTLD